MKIGVVGTGVMGAPMARNLLRAGYEVTVCNRSRVKAERLAGNGAMVVDTPAEVAARSEIVITNVPDTPDVQKVVLGPSGIIEGAAPDITVIDMSTISPQVTREIAVQLERSGINMLDAPVTGGEKGAIEGTLVIMVGGPISVLERCRAALEVIGGKIVHAGGHGQGQLMKLCNQIAIASNLMAAAEAVAFCRVAGLDTHLMLEAVGGGAAGSWVINMLGPKMASHDFKPGFMIKLQQKDLRLALAAASELGVALPGVALVNQLFTAAESAGHSDDGTQALITVLEKLADIGADRAAGSKAH